MFPSRAHLREHRHRERERLTHPPAVEVVTRQESHFQGGMEVTWRSTLPIGGPMFWDTTGKSGIFNALTHKIDGYLCQPPAAAQCEARDCKHPVHLELNLESELQGDDIRPHRSSLSPQEITKLSRAMYRLWAAAVFALACMPWEASATSLLMIEGG